MKHTLNHCRPIFKDHIIAAYFFDARGHGFEKSVLGMLRSLLHQLLAHESRLYEAFIPRFRMKERMHKTWEWYEEELKEFLLSNIKLCQPRPLLLLLDALDECNEAEVKRVISFLESLSNNAIDANVSLNICLSSRHYPNIRMQKKLELVIDDRKGHKEDITVYVRDKLPKEDAEIEQSLIEKASGVFMWVVLVIAMLNQAFDEGKVELMRKKLCEVPNDLEEVFHILLNKDCPDHRNEDCQDKRETILMLQWVLFAERSLKPEELYFAVIAGIDAQNLGTWDRSKVTDDDIQRRITSSSKGLIETRKRDTITIQSTKRRITSSSKSLIKTQKRDTGTVQFIHESVRDFLLRNRRLKTLDSALELDAVGTSHDRLKDCCMSYLMIKDLPPVDDRSHVKGLSHSYPFLEYASTNALFHAEEAQARGITQKDFMQLLRRQRNEFDRLRCFYNAFQRNIPLQSDKTVDTLYLVASCGYYELTKTVLCENMANVNAQGGFWGSALEAASAEGEDKIVEILLDKGADVNVQGGPLGNALQAALFKGGGEIVAMLVDKGANINAQGGPFGNALQAALLKGTDEIVAMLLDEGADVNA